MIGRRLLLLALAAAAGCGQRPLRAKSPSAVIPAQTSTEPNLSSLDAELLRRVRATPETPRTDIERLVQDLLSRQLRARANRGLIPQVLLLSGAISSRVIPPQYAHDIVLMTEGDLQALARRHGSVEYWHANIERHSNERITINVGLTVAPIGSMVLCCYGREETYERKAGHWVLVDASDYDV
jgi:hypothetical protein